MNYRLVKTEIVGLLLLALLTAIAVWYPRPQQTTNKVVIAFGDSLTRGYGVVPPERNFVVYLSDYVHLPIINAGVTGDTTADALIRFKDEVLDKNPSVVMVLLGSNDYFKGYSTDVVRANLTTIVQKIQEKGAKVILIGVNTQLQPEYEATIQKVANDEKVFAYIPGILNGILFRKDLMYDNLHPNEKGHEIIAQKILPALQRALSEN